VGPLEGLWWADDLTAFDTDRKGEWMSTMMIAQPDALTPERFEVARDEIGRKKELPAMAKARLERFEGGIVRAGPARRTVQRRKPDHRDAPCVHPGPGLQHQRQAPRDLPERSSPERAGEVEDHHSPTVLGLVSLGGDALMTVSDSFGSGE
jgi:hypothetical protein